MSIGSISSMIWKPASPRALEHCTRAVNIDHVQQTAIAFAADQLARIMHNFDYQRAIDLLSQRPELFPTFVAALKTLTTSTTDLARAIDAGQKRETIIRDSRQSQVIPTNSN